VSAKSSRELLLVPRPAAMGGATLYQRPAPIVADPRHDEATLDPADWGAFRALGRRMVDDMLESLEEVRERPVWQPIPEAVAERFARPLPVAPEGAEQAYDDFRRDVLPFPLRVTHPRFWGWVSGTGTPLGMLADLLAAGINANVAGGVQAANLVEEQVLSWCKTLFGFPATASGLLMSGTSMATLVALTVARNHRAEIDLRRHGLRAAPRPTPSTPAPSTISMRWPTCARPKSFGCTSMAPTAPLPCSRPRCARCWPVWNGPTLSLSISTSGCTSRSTPAAC
jgi:hypothetical protein